MTLATYRELASFLTSGMQRRNRPSVKTFIVEQVAPIPGDRRTYVRRSLDRASPRRRVEVTPLEGAPAVYQARVGRIVLWVDTSDSRFWEIHTLDDAGDVSAILERWVGIASEIDLPWLPAELLARASSAGDFIGFGLTYSREFFAEDGEAAPALTVRVAGTEAGEALEELRRQPAFQRTSALSSVRVRDALTGPGAFQLGRLTTSLTTRGRVTSRGSNFDQHRLFVRYTAELYREASESVTRQLTVGAMDKHGEGLRGPVRLDLVTAVDDLANFCGRAFSGADPFRLWGFLERRGADLIVANAFDRRSGYTLSVEASSTHWVVYLPDDTPGSVLLRIVTILQQHHDRRITLPGVGD